MTGGDRSATGLDETVTESGAPIATVLMTTPDAEVAERIVRRLVEERLAACGNIVPGATSIYRWENRIERAAEAMVVLKTTGGLVDQLLERAAELHPYDVPELLVHEVAAGSEPYMEWVRDECGPAHAARPAEAGRR